MMKKVAKPAGHHNTVRQLMLGTVGTLSVLAAGAVTAHAKTITVKQGDTIWGIAQREGLSTDALEQANPSVSRLNNSIDLIYAGQQLNLPTNNQGDYVVKSGDTLSKIAARYHVTVAQLVEWNHINNQDLIYVGQHLVVKAGHTVSSANQVAQPVEQQPASAAPVAQDNQQPATEQSSSTQVQQPTTEQAQQPVQQAPEQNTTQQQVPTAPVQSEQSSASQGQQANNNQPANDDQNNQQQTQSVNVAQVNQQQGNDQSQLLNSFIAVQQPQQETANNQTTADQSNGNQQTTDQGQQTPSAPQSQTTNQNNNASQNSANADLQSGSVVSLAVKLANSNIPYSWGGSSLSGMDCSGLVDYVYAHSEGKQLPHYTVSLESCVTQKPVSQAQPGDLLFWGQHGNTYHVAIYIGNNQYVAAPQPGQNVDIETISPAFAPSFAGSVN